MGDIKVMSMKTTIYTVIVGAIALIAIDQTRKERARTKEARDAEWSLRQEQRKRKQKAD